MNTHISQAPEGRNMPAMGEAHRILGEFKTSPESRRTGFDSGAMV